MAHSTKIPHCTSAAPAHAAKNTSSWLFDTKKHHSALAVCLCWVAHFLALLPLICEPGGSPRQQWRWFGNMACLKLLILSMPSCIHSKSAQDRNRAQLLQACDSCSLHTPSSCAHIEMFGPWLPARLVCNPPRGQLSAKWCAQ